MSSRVDTFNIFVSAVDTLKDVFNNNREILAKGESLSSYSLIVDLQDLSWLDLNLSLIINSLLPAKFRLKIKFKVHL